MRGDALHEERVIEHRVFLGRPVLDRDRGLEIAIESITDDAEKALGFRRTLEEGSDEIAKPFEMEQRMVAGEPSARLDEAAQHLGMTSREILKPAGRRAVDRLPKDVGVSERDERRAIGGRMIVPNRSRVFFDLRRVKKIKIIKKQIEKTVHDIMPLSRRIIEPAHPMKYGSDEIKTIEI